MEPKGRRQDPLARSSKPPRVDHRPRSLRRAGLVALVGGIAAITGIAGPFAGLAFAKPFLPLSVGDRWNYEASNSRIAQVRIMESFMYRDQLVYRVRGYLFGFFDADVLFLTDRNGNLAELNPDLVESADPGKTNLLLPPVSGVWYPWADLERPVDIPMFAED